MPDLSNYYRPENIFSLIIAFLAFCISIASAGAAIASVLIAYKNYKINEGNAWLITNINNNEWRLERRHTKPAKIIGVAISSNGSGRDSKDDFFPVPAYIRKGEHIILRAKFANSHEIGRATCRVYYKDNWRSKWSYKIYDAQLMHMLTMKYSNDRWYLLADQLINQDKKVSIWERVKNILGIVRTLGVKRWQAPFPIEVGKTL
jgi:hypothetical protein